MRYIVTTVVGAVLAGAIVATASRFEWANYDPTKSVKLSGTVRTAENIDGFVVIRIKTEREHQPSTTWVVVLGSPKELKEAGLALELRLDIPVEATVWERKPGGNKEARAQQISLNHSQTAILHPN